MHLASVLEMPPTSRMIRLETFKNSKERSLELFLNTRSRIEYCQKVINKIIISKPAAAAAKKRTTFELRERMIYLAMLQKKNYK